MTDNLSSSGKYIQWKQRIICSLKVKQNSVVILNNKKKSIFKTTLFHHSNKYQIYMLMTKLFFLPLPRKRCLKQTNMAIESFQ